MDTLFKVIIMVTVAVSGGLMFRSWLENQRKAKKRKTFVQDMAKKAEGGFQNALKGQDTDDVKAYVSGAYSLFLRDLPYRHEGPGEAMKYYSDLMKDGASQTMFNKKFMMLGSSTAIVTYNWTKGKNSGKTTQIWRVEKGSWKIVHDHTSLNKG